MDPRQLFASGIAITSSSDAAQPPTAIAVRDTVGAATLPLPAGTTPADPPALALLDGATADRPLIATWLGQGTGPRLCISDGSGALDVAGLASDPGFAYFAANTPEQVSLVWTEPLGNGVKIQGASMAGATGTALSDLLGAPAQLDDPAGGVFHGGALLPDPMGGAALVAAEDGHVWRTVVSSSRVWASRRRCPDRRLAAGAAAEEHGCEWRSSPLRQGRAVGAAALTRRLLTVAGAQCTSSKGCTICRTT